MPELLPFQRRGVDYLLEQRRLLLADDMGLGKTAQAITAVREAGAYPALVVCPAYLQDNWLREISLWDPGATSAKVAVSDSGMRLVGPRWVVLSYEAMVAKERVIPIVMQPQGIVFDESHYLKTAASERTRAAVAVAASADVRILLSGTPVLNRPKEIWAQLCVLGVHDRFYAGSHADFDRCFCGGRGARLGGVEQAKRLELLSASLAVKGVFLRRSKEQVLPELPPLRRAYVPIDVGLLPPGAAGPDGERLEAARAKLPQVFQWLDDFLETGRPLVVFAHHREIVEAVAEHVGVRALTGEVSPADRQAEVDKFQAGEQQVIVFSLHAGQCGYTLTRASDVAFVQEDWVPAVVDQAAARCHRIGQAQAVTEWHLVARGTVEERMFGLLDSKDAVTSAVTDGRCSPGTQQVEFEAAVGGES